MDLCGHATLAAAHVVLDEISEDEYGDEVTFVSEFSGELKVTKENGKYK